jgi:hypothetical protein
MNFSDFLFLITAFFVLENWESVLCKECDFLYGGHPVVSSYDNDINYNLQHNSVLVFIKAACFDPLGSSSG